MPRRLLLPLLAVICCLSLLLPQAAGAAEVLQVRGGKLLQVGDHNRNYSVELACLTLPADAEPAASAWLRQELPRRTRVNLRPLGNREGTLVARVQRLAADGTAHDLSDGLIKAGLASALSECQA